MIFRPEHEFYKAAIAADQLDDWLPHAEYLIGKWAEQKSEDVKFASTWKIIIAASALRDNLLPVSARVALCEVLFKVILEAESKKLDLASLHISPPKPGRKSDRNLTFSRVQKVMTLLREGKTTTEAYDLVAEEYCKSPDTIRREYERTLKTNRHKLGKSKNDFPG